MPRDKKILYVLAALIPCGLAPILLLRATPCILSAAGFLAALAVAAALLIKKRCALSLQSKTVLLLMAVFAAVYLTLFYLSGLSLGFVKATTVLSASLLVHKLVPMALIIVASEAVRRILLSQRQRAVTAMAFLTGVLSELAVAGGLNGLSGFSAVMDMMGLVLLPAIAAGLLYQYVSLRHGALPCTVYRALFALFPYFIPISPDVPDALISFTRILYPLAVLFFLRALFEKSQRRATASPRATHLKLLSAALAIALCAATVCLISGRFRYATVIIATGSMTGELNVGDAAIYERYEGQSIETGDVIVFERDRSLVIHRVVEITHVNAQTRYYTKGDANENRDVGYITSSDIIGIIDFKISFVGYPSLWMRRIFEIGS